MRQLSKGYAVLFLILAVSVSAGYNHTVEAGTQLPVKDKFEPGFWDKIQRLKADGISVNLSLMVWLNENATSMNIEELKNYAAELFQSKHDANVYGILKVLPIIMVKAPLSETENIVAYDFVEIIGDGDRKLHAKLDVSRQAIRSLWLPQWF